MMAAGKSQPTRRSHLRSLAAVTVPAWLSSYRRLSAANHDKVKIADIKIVTPQGPRTYTPVRVDTGADVHGFAESYGSPGLGVKEEIHRLKERSVGNDPLQIDRLYTEYRYADGSAHAQQRAMSGIEMALWDLAGKLLDGKFRDMVRLYDHSHPDDSFDKAVLRDWAQQVKGQGKSLRDQHAQIRPPLWNRAGIDPGRDPTIRMLSRDELRRLRKGFENCREALGFEHDILIGCHWEFDLHSSIGKEVALKDVKPRFLEDPLPGRPVSGCPFRELEHAGGDVARTDLHRKQLDAPRRAGCRWCASRCAGKAGR